MKELNTFRKFLTESENDDIRAEMFIKIHNILDAGGHDEERADLKYIISLMQLKVGHDEERADLAEYIRDNFEYDMV